MDMTTATTIVAAEVEVAVQDIEGDHIVRRRNIDVVIGAVHPYRLTALLVGERAIEGNTPKRKRSRRSEKEAAVTIILNPHHPKNHTLQITPSPLQSWKGHPGHTH
jgi:hypothetical protein